MISETNLISTLIPLPPGAFWMGESPEDKFATDTERPRHWVRLTARCALGKNPITVGQYRLFAPQHAPGEPADWPVVNLSWEEAEAYCAWARAATGQAFRLPSEAEWEYACRAGTESCFSTGTELTVDQANYLYSEEGERVGLGRRQRVASYPANPYGLHDLHGNVCEFTQDTWHADLSGAPADGRPWVAGGDARLRVIRGGAWDYLPRLLRSAWRDALPTGVRRDNVGFRIALTLPT